MRVKNQEFDGWLQIWGFHPLFEKYYCELFTSPSLGRKYYFDSEGEMAAFVASFDVEEMSFADWAAPKIGENISPMNPT